MNFVDKSVRRMAIVLIAVCISIGASNSLFAETKEQCLEKCEIEYRADIKKALAAHVIAGAGCLALGLIPGGQVLVAPCLIAASAATATLTANAIIDRNACREKCEVE